MRKAIPLALFALVVSACQSLADGAEEKFSNEYTCPKGRLEVRARQDLRRSSFEFGASQAATAPAEVAADPERLALWHKQHPAHDATQYDDLDDIEEVRGCGKQAFFACHRMQQHFDHVTCFRESNVPPSVSHW